MSLLLVGTRYMVVDCGGGTIDITVHEMVSTDRPVAELHKVCGAPFGSTGSSPGSYITCACVQSTSILRLVCYMRTFGFYVLYFAIQTASHKTYQ